MTFLSRLLALARQDTRGVGGGVGGTAPTDFSFTPQMTRATAKKPGTEQAIARIFLAQPIAEPA